MATNKRMTAKDYRAEYNHLTTQLAVLGKQIERRFQLLCEQYPDVPLYKPLYKTFGFPGEDVPAGAFIESNPPRLDTEARINCIGVIEEYIASKHPHKQTTIDWSERGCISDKSPDGKHHYQDDSTYCYHCGLNKNYK